MMMLEGALSWPDGAANVAIPGTVVHHGNGPFDSRAFEPRLDAYEGDRPILGSYAAEFTPTGEAQVAATVHVREPRYRDGRGWLADWEMFVGAEERVRARISETNIPRAQVHV